MSDENILIVEDDLIIQEVLENLLQGAGYQITVMESVGAAWNLLLSRSQRFDVVLLDRNLPDADGLELLTRIKADAELMRMPVVMQTSINSQEEVHAGLQAGAHYYLTKPIDQVALLAVVRVAIKDYRDYLQLQSESKQAASILLQLSHAQFFFKTPQQAREIAVMLSKACPDAQKVIMGLSELMLNAVEHGNLAITYKEKGQLLNDERLHEEINLRLDRAEFAERTAAVNFERGASEIRFHIRDDGEGFDWANYLEISPERIFDLHGRGIAMARMLSFDQIEYMGKGNEVVATLKL